MNFPGYPAGTIKPLMEPEGLGTSGVLVMAEALGENEEHDRLPLRPYAEAGSLFERALNRAGIPRESLTLTNLVWYRPPFNRLAGTAYEMDAIRACAPFNEDLVVKVQPKVILALGGLAYRELTGLTGEKTGIQQTRGMITQGSWFKGIPVIGTYHPSFLRRGSKELNESGVKTESASGGVGGMSLLGVMIRDLQLALQIARDGAPEFKYHDYKLGATIQEWLEFEQDVYRNPGLAVSYDWETPRSARVLSEDDMEAGERERDITQGQMSLRPGQAIVSEFTPDLLPIWGRILASPNPKIGWNSRKFDDPEAESYGMSIKGEKHDLMDFWHHLQPDLPRGLQYATSFFVPEIGPWKHMIYGQPLWYGALDVDAPQRIWAGLKRTSYTIREPHSGRSLWDGYHEQVVRLAPVLDRMSARGMPINDSKRLGLGTEFGNAQAEIDLTLQGLVPEEIRNVEPKEGYKRKQRLPSACLEAAGQAGLFESATSSLSGPGDQSVEVCPVIRNRVVDENGVIYVTRTFKDEKTKLPVERWARLLPFVTGADQVKRYIRYKHQEESNRPVKAQKWIMPISPKDGKETSDKLGLHKLYKATGDQVIKFVLESRELQTAKGTFIDGWAPAKDGRVHSTFGFKPATGQLSSQNPNAQNFPKHKKVSRKMNQILEARPGHTFVSLDWKSFHVLTTGFEAQDPLYMRMARLDMHSFFALVGLLRLDEPEKFLELPDDELKSKLAWYREQEKVYSKYACSGHPAGMTFGEIRDEQAKAAILGVGFGQTAGGMFKRNPDSFASLKAAKDVALMLNRIFPLPEKWRRAVRLEADVHASLLTRFGYVRRFWDVFSRKIIPVSYQPRTDQIVIMDKAGRRVLLGPGDDHEAVVAYRPANNAFGIKRQVMVELGEAGLDERYQLINEIHDCLRFECPDSLVDECVLTVREMMQRPSPILVDPVVAPDGLWCQVDLEMSSSGGNLDKSDASNPTGMRKVKI